LEEVPESPVVEETPPSTGTGGPVMEPDPLPAEPPGQQPETPRPTAACSGPDDTARLAWSYESAWGQTVDFRGTMDADGHTYWTECESAYWSDKEPGERPCELLSASREGVVRYRLALPNDSSPAVHAVDAERLYLTTLHSVVSARTRGAGRELWSTDLGKPRAEFPEEGTTFHVDSLALSPPHVLVVARNALGPGEGQGLLVALRADTGAVVWKALTPPLGPPHGLPLVVDARGNSYGGAFDPETRETTLVSYTADGKLRWKTRRAGERRPTAVDGDRLLLERAEVADAATGAPLATFVTATSDSDVNRLGVSSSPYGRAAFQAAGVLVLPALPCTGEGCPETLHPGRTFLYGLDPEDGSLRWHRPVGAWPMAPVLTRRDTLLLVDRPPKEGCEEDYSCIGDDSHTPSVLRELDAKDGRELAVCALPGTAPYITPPALHRGRVVMGAWTNWLASNDWSRRMSIRAFDLSVPTEPASAGWVTAGGGNTRSGTPGPER
jgi:outer membrane protein assembly factor BamB